MKSKASPPPSQLPAQLLQSRMAALQHLLFVPSRARALSLVLRQPQLLSYSSETLKAHLEALRGALRVSTDMALLLVARHPNLLCFSPEAIQVREEARLFYG